MKKPLLLLILLLWVMPAFAVNVPSIYQVEIPVTSQSSDEKQASLKKAFLYLLTKLSGDQQIDENRLIQASAENAQDYVDEFSYKTNAKDSFILAVKFNQEEVKRLLKKAGIPFWGESRPLILVWLAITDRSHANEIIGNETADDSLTAMQQESMALGLPIIFPMMDMTDLNEISATDVNTMSMPKIAAASLRYMPEALLIGSIQQSNNEYQSVWQLNLGDNQWQWKLNDDSVKKIYTSILNQVNQILVKHYLVKSADAQPMWLNLEILNVAERKDLTHLIQYLKQISQVQQVKLAKISPESVELAVLVQSDMNNFQKNAVIGRRMVLKDQDVRNSKLRFDWIR